jgi:predicted benzoate:H+ symporter BenE
VGGGGRRVRTPTIVPQRLLDPISSHGAGSFTPLHKAVAVVGVTPDAITSAMMVTDVAMAVRRWVAETVTRRPYVPSLACLATDVRGVSCVAAMAATVNVGQTDVPGSRPAVVGHCLTLLGLG